MRSFIERRHSPRIGLVMGVKKTSRHGVFLCQSTDLSIDGISLVMTGDVPLEQTDAVFMMFALPGTHTVLKMQGTVVRSLRGGRLKHVGILFLNPDPRAVRYLVRFIKNPSVSISCFRS